MKEGEKETKIFFKKMLWKMSIKEDKLQANVIQLPHFWFTLSENHQQIWRKQWSAFPLPFFIANFESFLVYLFSFSYFLNNNQMKYEPLPSAIACLVSQK